MTLELGVIASHESAVRSMVSESSGVPYVALHSLDEARAVLDSVVIFEGDYGGQIYLTVPAAFVTIDEASLRELLRRIDATEWHDEDGAGLHFEILPAGAGVAGGMGGGQAAEGLWLHSDLEEKGLRPAVERALRGDPYELEPPKITTDWGRWCAAEQSGAPS